MRTYCTARGTLLSALWGPKWEGNPKMREYCVCVCVCVCISDSLCCTAETDTAV